MKQILLDSSFIITCVKQKIDFFEEIKLKGMQIIIPTQVIQEIKKLKNQYAELAIKLLQKNKFKEVNIGKGHVDKRIIDYSKENPAMIIATLDKEIKNKTKSHKLIIRGEKKLEIV